MIDYRKKYEDYFGIELGDDMDVHHIDFNRENNDIDNLLAIPSELHTRYHFYANHSLEKYNNKFVRELNIKLTGMTYYAEMMYGLCRAIMDMTEWLQRKTLREMAEQIKEEAREREERNGGTQNVRKDDN